MPVPGLKDFLLKLKSKNIKIGLVTSGLYEKAWPEILSAFKTLGMGEPAEFYDAIISAGFPLRKGEAGTLGSTPAIQSAVMDALKPLGVRHIDLPLTPSRVWQAIQDATG